MQVEAILLAHAARYPAAQARDYLKLLYQSEFGAGHLLRDEDAAVAALRREWDSAPRTGPVFDLLGGSARLHLGPAAAAGLSFETAARLFLLSARAQRGTAEGFTEKLTALQAMCRSGKLPVSAEACAREIADWRAAGCPIPRHSEAFRAAYRPAYRVVDAEFAWYFPAIAALDGLPAGSTAALDGCCAAGKSTLAAMLARVFDASVFHADDFFLRPEQRTPARLAEPGGNLDRERLESEILTPLSTGRPVVYRPWSCRTGAFLPAVTEVPHRLALVEGAYSAQPALQRYYARVIALQVGPEAQLRRLRARNSSMLEAFQARWIPLEQSYFHATALFARADAVLDTDAFFP